MFLSEKKSTSSALNLTSSPLNLNYCSNNNDTN